MRKTTIFVLLTILLVSTHISAAGPAFRDLSWGDSIKSIGNCVLIDDEDEFPGIQIYRKVDENLKLGSFPVASIDYHFFDDRLMKIVVNAPSTDAEENYDSLERMLTAKYGEPETHFFSHTLDWNYNDTHAQLIWEITGKVYFRLNSIPIQESYDAWLEGYKNKQADANATAW